MVRTYRKEEIPAVYSRDEIPDHESNPGVSQQYFRGLDTLVGFTTITPEKSPNPHSHPWEQINFVLDGACEFRVGDEVVAASEGDIFVVPPEVSHTAEPPEAECTILFTGPLREDYAAKTEYQREF